MVEDQDGVRAVAANFLEEMGYKVVEATDGAHALSRLDEHPDIDLMFSDVVMPGGLNGFDLAEAAKEKHPALRVVHTSGYPKDARGQSEDPRASYGPLIMKPYRREELERIIAEAFQN